MVDIESSDFECFRIRGGPIFTHFLQELAISALDDREDDDPQQHFYTRDTLRDRCGCLITISDYHVSLAHYTVSEFLWSDRAAACSASYFARKPDQALYIHAKSLMRLLLRQDQKKAADHRRSILDFRQYCLESCKRLLEVPVVRTGTGEYAVLVRTFLANPRVPIDDLLPSTLTEGEMSIEWLQRPDNPDVVALVHAVARGLHTVADDILSTSSATILASEFQASVKDVAGSSHHGAMIHHNVLDLFLFWAIKRDRRHFLYLLSRLELDALTATQYLMMYLAGFSTGSISNADRFKIIELLVYKQGADVNGMGFEITPLQIAVWRQDLVGVETLLQFEADVNAIGYRDSHAPEMLSPYVPPGFGKMFGAASAVHIARHVEELSLQSDEMNMSPQNMRWRQKILEKLQGAGGNDFFCQSLPDSDSHESLR